MRSMSRWWCTFSGVIFSLGICALQLHADPVQKEWTFLIFLNGHNNLDSYGSEDLNEMEQVGSSDQVNVVVQWASDTNTTTKRLLVQRDNDTAKVTSPTIEDLPRVDMGDYKKLIEFVEWGVKNYPAKHYFIDVWNHGSGWHRNRRQGIVRNISFDDHTNHSITTAELGLAMKASSEIMGHKVDIYGSDACLMQMLEVNTELANYVDYVVGSQEVEPADGWPYDKLLETWVAQPAMTPAEVSAHLAKEYVASYPSSDDVQLSAVNLNFNANLVASLRAFSTAVQGLSTQELKSLKDKVSSVFGFYYSDYADLQDLLETFSAVGPAALQNTSQAIQGALKDYLVANYAAPHYPKAHGISVWLPRSSFTLDMHGSKYDALQIASTGWKDALKKILTAAE